MIDSILSIGLLTSLSILLTYLSLSLPHTLKTQKQLLEELAQFKNDAAQPHLSTLNKYSYNHQWEQLSMTTSSGITLNALIQKEQ